MVYNVPRRCSLAAKFHCNYTSVLRENETFVWKIKRRNSNMKKLVALLLAVMMLSVSVAALAEAPEGYPAVIEGLDFGGKTVTFYDYWSGDGARVAEPNEQQQAQYDYRDWVNATYNVTIEQKQGGDWATCAEEFINFTSAPTDDLRAYIIEPGKVLSLVNNGLVAPWPADYDFSADKWNKANIDYWTIGGEVYGVSTGNTEVRGGIFFNKRLLEECGVTADELYDLQAAGTWTWAAFEDVLKKTTLDKDNDGVYDVWGVTGSGDDMFVLAVFANGGSFFGTDEEGKIEPTMDSQASIDAMLWGKSILDNYWYKQPADGNWDYFREAFKQGTAVFLVDQTYNFFNDGAFFDDMEDEWGMLAFPVPNEGDTYLQVASENTLLIPAVYTEDQIKLICAAYDLWSNPTPGFEDDDSWATNMYNKNTDDRTIEETMAMLRESEHAAFNKVSLLGVQNDVLGNSLLWQLAGSDPAALIEAGMPAWQALCDTFNAK